MNRYARRTVVSADKSQAKIKRLAQRYGAHQFGFMEQAGQATVLFSARDRQLKFILPLPKLTDDFIIYHEPTGRRGRRSKRTELQAAAALDAETRRRWRALVLVLKAKLESVESGITTFDEEFLTHIVLPDSTTVGERLVPMVVAAYGDGKMPRMLEAT